MEGWIRDLRETCHWWYLSRQHTVRGDWEFLNQDSATIAYVVQEWCRWASTLPHLPHVLDSFVRQVPFWVGSLNTWHKINVRLRILLTAPEKIAEGQSLPQNLNKQSPLQTWLLCLHFIRLRNFCHLLHWMSVFSRRSQLPRAYKSPCATFGPTPLNPSRRKLVRIAEKST
jgi:hypothetical protein